MPLSAGRLAAVHRGRTQRRGLHELSAGLRGAAGGGHLGDQCNYTDRPLFRDPRCSSGRIRAGSTAGRLTRRMGFTSAMAASPSCCALHAVHPHVCALRGGRGGNGTGQVLAYNVGGALVWVLGIATAGYFFGNFALGAENLDKIIWAMILCRPDRHLWRVAQGVRRVWSEDRPSVTKTRAAGAFGSCACRFF